MISKFNLSNFPMFSVVPNLKEEDIVSDVELPPGLILIEDFITLEEESKLLEALDWNDNGKKHFFSCT